MNAGGVHGLVPARTGASGVAGACALQAQGERGLARRPWAPTDGRGAEGRGGCEPSRRPDVRGDRVTAQPPPPRTPSHGQARRRPAGETRMRGHGRGPRAPVGQVIPVRFLDRILYFHKHSECFPWAAFPLGSAGTGGRFSGHIERGKSVNFDLEER